MTVPFHHIRKPVAILFGVMAACMVVFYASSVAASPKYSHSDYPQFEYASHGNPIQFIESAENSDPPVAIAQLSHIVKSLDFFPDLHFTTRFKIEALSVSPYLRNAFYVVVNIHAP